MTKMLSDSWEFNVFDIYDFNKAGGKLDIYYKWIIENHNTIDGDILEAGVFRGKSLLATALLLKNLESDKKVYGFDSFSGFPPVYHQNDDLKVFQSLHEQSLISDNHFNAHLKLKEYRSMLKSVNVTVADISSSTDFSDTSEEMIIRKADYLGLDNIVLVNGDFSATMQQDQLPDLKLMAALFDCDLYSSYEVSLPYVWSRLQTGGYTYLDEYYSLKFPGARIACDEFFASKLEKPQMAIPTPREFERWYAIKK